MENNNDMFLFEQYKLLLATNDEIAASSNNFYSNILSKICPKTVPKDTQLTFSNNNMSFFPTDSELSQLKVINRYIVNLNIDDADLMTAATKCLESGEKKKFVDFTEKKALFETNVKPKVNIKPLKTPEQVKDWNNKLTSSMKYFSSLDGQFSAKKPEFTGEYEMSDDDSYKDENDEASEERRNKKKPEWVKNKQELKEKSRNQKTENVWEVFGKEEFSLIPMNEILSKKEGGYKNFEWKNCETPIGLREKYLDN